MQVLRHRLAAVRQAVEWSFGPVLIALVVAQVFISRPLHDMLHVVFVVVAVAFIVYEAFIKAAPLLGLAGVALQMYMAWPRIGGYSSLTGVLSLVVVLFLLLTRPVPDIGPPAAPASPTPAIDPDRPAKPLPKLGDPDFRYLPPPDVRR